MTLLLTFGFQNKYWILFKLCIICIVECFFRNRVYHSIVYPIGEYFGLDTYISLAMEIFQKYSVEIIEYKKLCKEFALKLFSGFRIPEKQSFTKHAMLFHTLSRFDLCSTNIKMKLKTIQNSLVYIAAMVDK